MVCFLVKDKGMKPEDAYTFVREKRPQISLAPACPFLSMDTVHRIATFACTACSSHHASCRVLNAMHVQGQWTAVLDFYEAYCQSEASCPVAAAET